MDPLFLCLLLVNLISLVFFGVDKRRARRRMGRISEKALLLSAAAGPLGAMVGMQIFRHKTKHRRFLFFVPVFFLLQVTLLLWGFAK